MNKTDWRNKLMNSNNRRSSLLKKNVLASFIFKGWSGLMCFLLVPLTLNCIGEYKNGIWMSIASMFVWIETMDIGLGNGLRNKLVAAIAHNDNQRAQVLVSTTFVALFLIIVPIMFVLLALINSIDIYALLNVDIILIPGLRKCFAIAIILFCSTLIFKFIGNVYQGLQLPAVNNFFIAISHTFIVILTYFYQKQQNCSLEVITLINTGCPLIVFLLAYPYTFFYKFRYLSPSLKLFDLQCVKEILSLGVKFFVLQFVSVLTFMLSNFIVSHFYTPSMVTPYQISYRYFSLLLTVFVIVITPYWSATTDALENRDFEWIKIQVKNVKRLTSAFIAIAIVMVIISKVFIHVWIGNGVYVPLTLNVFMALYISIMLSSTALCYFLNGLGLLRIQLICSLSSLSVFLLLTMSVVRAFDGIVYIVILLCIVSLPSLICNYIQLHKVINGKANGIWSK